MVETVEFGNIQAARRLRNDPQFRPFLAPSDNGREKTVRLVDDIPEPALSEIVGEAAETKAHRSDKAGQAPLSDAERSRIDFSRPGVNVPKARSIKAIATNEGVSDWLQFADLTLTVDENREILARASREERNRRGLGLDQSGTAATDSRMAQANKARKRGQLDSAKNAALSLGSDAGAAEFLRDRGSPFDIDFSRTDDDRIRGQGEDFERLHDAHTDRSEQAQTLDEKQSAPVTRDPLEWARNPDELDFPGIDTVQPHKLHKQRDERAREIDEDQLAPFADTREQWAMNPEEYDWPGVDTPEDADEYRNHDGASGLFF